MLEQTYHKYHIWVYYWINQIIEMWSSTINRNISNSFNFWPQFTNILWMFFCLYKLYVPVFQLKHITFDLFKLLELTTQTRIYLLYINLYLLVAGISIFVQSYKIKCIVIIYMHVVTRLCLFVRFWKREDLL